MRYQGGAKQEGRNIMSINKVILLGRLGSDVELKYTPSSTAVANMSVATSEKFKDKSGAWQEKTEWSKVVVFGKTAENCSKYLNKGSQVYIEGSIQTRSWENKEGKKQYSTEIIARNVQFIDKKESNSGDSMLDSKPEIITEDQFTTDDIPF